jgi:hypothetical protein
MYHHKLLRIKLIQALIVAHQSQLLMQLVLGSRIDRAHASLGIKNDLLVLPLLLLLWLLKLSVYMNLLATRFVLSILILDVDSSWVVRVVQGKLSHRS